MVRSDPFTAQTTLAASYGLLQMMYATAVTTMHWTGDANGARNPSLLFDTEENHARQLGSLGVGSAKVVKDFKTVMAGSNVTVDNPAVLLSLFIDAWQQYNSGKRTYGTEVGTHVPQYNPEPRTPVLGGVQ